MSTDPKTRARALTALLLLVPVPSIATWLGMVGAEGETLGNVAFGLGKIWILLLPVTWLMLVDRQKPTIPLPARRGMAAACATGAAIVVAIATAYFLLGRHWIDTEFMREQAAEVGLTTRTRFLLGALYWCTVNSLLEEYVWRWFVSTRCEVFMPRPAAVVASGLFFTLHHIIALNVYFDWRVTVLGSVGVFIGGATWSWLYLRYRNIWAAYASHVFADVIIFTIGWYLLFM
ncbi:MAG: CPBP family intramembrane glutamic endopeptidase [Planctomycetota bacterium]